MLHRHAVERLTTELFNGEYSFVIEDEQSQAFSYTGLEDMKLGMSRARERLGGLGRRLGRWLRAEPNSPSAPSVRFSPGAMRAVEQVERLLAESWELAAEAEEESDPRLLAAQTVQELAKQRLLSIPFEPDLPLLQRHLPSSELDTEASPDSNASAEATTRTRTMLAAVLISQMLSALIRHRRGFWPRGALRLAMTAAAFALVGWGCWHLREALTKPKDLLARATVTPSSRYLNWPTHLMDFHTDIEDRPAAVYDMGSAREVSRFLVENTKDFAERAAPLAIELSLDGSTFNRVASIQRQFKVWQPHIEPQSARYVRVVALHRTYLHLKRVEAY